jgi:raffinose/stachyose/melibiose transport system permease protein
MRKLTTTGVHPGWKLPAHVIMILFTILTIAPLVWMIYTAFKPHSMIIRDYFSFPTSLYVTNFTEAWKRGNLGLYFFNSIFYSGVATALTTFIALAAGYALGKFNYRISGLFYALYLMGLLITLQSLIVPLFIMELKIGIENTRLGVILPYVAFGLPFGVFLARTYMKDIPDSMEEAAIMDGAGYITIFLRVILPIATPVAATILIFSFLANWNEFMMIFILTSKETLRSLTVGIHAFAGGQTRNYGLQFAALVIGTIPMIVFYIFFNKQLAKGFAAGAIKG